MQELLLFSHQLVFDSTIPQTAALQECCVQSLGSIPGLGRSPEEGNGNPLQYSWEIPWTEEPGGLQCMGLEALDTT